MEYGKILRKLRKERNMSQEEVALFAGVGKSQISKYERGENSPTLDIAVLIAKCLGVSVDEMVDGNGEAPKNEVINERNAKELYGLPKGYIKTVKIAFSHEISPDDLLKMIDVAYNFKRK